MDVQKELHKSGESKAAKYRRLVVGDTGYLGLVRYELITLMSTWVPGALGLFLRSLLYPRMTCRCGKGVVFGTGVVLRHPHKITIGDQVVIDDNCVLDAKGEDNRGIDIGANVFFGRNTIVYCQDGDIQIGDGANIGTNCQIFSAKRVQIGRNVLVGAYSYFIGGGHRASRLDVPMVQQGRQASGIAIDDDVWIGAGVNILDGVKIGTGAIIGSGAVVNDNVEPFSIVAGVPAKKIGDRKQS